MSISGEANPGDSSVGKPAHWIHNLMRPNKALAINVMKPAVLKVCGFFCARQRTRLEPLDTFRRYAIVSEEQKGSARQNSPLLGHGSRAEGHRDAAHEIKPAQFAHNKQGASGFGCPNLLEIWRALRDSNSRPSGS